MLNVWWLSQELLLGCGKLFFFPAFGGRGSGRLTAAKQRSVKFQQQSTPSVATES